MLATTGNFTAYRIEKNPATSQNNTILILPVVLGSNHLYGKFIAWMDKLTG